MDAPVLPRIVGNSTEQSTPLLFRKMKTRETREYFKGLVWKHLLQGRNPPKPFIPTGLLKCKNPTCPNKWCNQKFGIFTGLNLVFPSELTSFWKFICARTNVLPFFQLHVSSYLCVAPEDKNMDFTGARKRETFRKNQWQEDGYAVIKHLFPTYLSVPAHEWTKTSKAFSYSQPYCLIYVYESKQMKL